ncbi:expressed unknown protein [Seminavis robusta]|uniref:DUF1996 domain-containing protein n=1 Tax=Seminavis robusta TaxID=568900 RepID=A0A9N8HU71_9STRA|nr:expressed unknown protein [Seminavis robusta]|eukprot:Sro1767_g296260.1 n/a (425) ;mRNA; f:1002-2484
MFPRALALLLTLGSAASFPVKWCLDYKPIGHVRTDPIINPACLSDHVHTFYGPGRLRPETTIADLEATPISETSGQVVDNKSLYWHPTVYKVDTDPVTSIKTYTRSMISSTTTYYRFDDTRRAEVVPFPKGLVMIGGRGADSTTDSECCSITDEDCVFGSETGQIFPSNPCPLFSIWMEFPICWNGELDSLDHSSHVAYTTDGTLDGPCPSSHQAGRFPQIQVFVRLESYPGGEHILSDGSDTLHADFMNAWDNDKLSSIIDECQPADLANEDACGCEDFFTLRTPEAPELDVAEVDIARAAPAPTVVEPEEEEEEEEEEEPEEEEEDEEEPEEEEEEEEEEEPEEEEDETEEEEEGETEEGDEEEDEGEEVGEEEEDEEEEMGFEVTLVNTRGTITPEPVDVVVGSLPRGACVGEILPATSGV